MSDTAGGYATDRAHKHAHAAARSPTPLRGRESTALPLADGWFAADNMFADLDARRLPAPRPTPMGVGDEATARLHWEYPPVVVGGLGRHVRNLAVALAELATTSSC